MTKIHIKASAISPIAACGDPSPDILVRSEQTFSLGYQGIRQCPECAAWAADMLDAMEEADRWATIIADELEATP